jgi:surface antigen
MGLATAGVLASPLLAQSPAAAANCSADPISGACVTPVNYQVAANGSTLALEKAPHTDNAIRRLADGTPLGVICQVNNGGRANGHASHTWDYVTAGGWVYNDFTTAPAAGSDGYSPGVRHCGGTTTGPTGGTSTGPTGGTTTGGVSTGPLDPAKYPWQNPNGWVDDQHGYYEGECVSFAAWAVRTDGLPDKKSPDFLGDARLWTGSSVDTVPRVGDVAEWDGGHNGAGSVGHVAYVSAVGNGTVTIEEYNWGNFHKFGTRTIATNIPSRYLHF